MGRSVVATVVVLGLAFAARVDAAPAQRCAAAKRNAAGRTIAGLTGCDAKAVGRGVAVDPECAARMRVKFARAWRKAEAKGACATAGDQDAILAKVDAHDADLEERLVTGGARSRCAAGKLRHAGKAGACRLRCAAKAVTRGLPLTDPVVARCRLRCAT
jgi:hypothetical protein